VGIPIWQVLQAIYILVFKLGQSLQLTLFHKRYILEWYWNSRMYGALVGVRRWDEQFSRTPRESLAWSVFHLSPSPKIYRLLFVATFQPSLLAVLPPCKKTHSSSALGWRHRGITVVWSTARVGWFPVNYSRSVGQRQLRGGASISASLASLTLLKHAVQFTWHRRMCVFLIKA